MSEALHFVMGNERCHRLHPSIINVIKDFISSAGDVENGINLKTIIDLLISVQPIFSVILLVALK